MACYVNGSPVAAGDAAACTQAGGQWMPQADTDFAGNLVGDTDWMGRSASDLATQRQSLLDDIEMGGKRAQPQQYEHYQNILNYTPVPAEQAAAQWKKENPTQAFLLEGTRDVIGSFLPEREDVKKAIDMIQDPEARSQALQYAKDNPWTTAVGIYTLFGAGKKIKKYGGKALDKIKNLDRYKDTKDLYKLVNDKPVLQTAGKKAKTIQGDLAKLGFSTYAINQFLKEQGYIDDDGNEIPQTDVIPPPPPAGTGADTGTGIGTGTGTVAKKGGFLSPVSGGAGGWDTGLYRLGELMTHFGTPLSKRGDSPAKRWTALQTSREKLAADIAKAQAGGKHKWTPPQVRDTATSYFDSYFGIDWIGGKDKGVERERFIRDVTDAKAMYPNKTLQQIMDKVMEEGDFI